METNYDIWKVRYKSIKKNRKTTFLFKNHLKRDIKF